MIHPSEKEDHMDQRYAQGISKGYYATGDSGAVDYQTEQPPCLFGDVHSRLAVLRDILSESNGALWALRDRLFGAVPVNTANSSEIGGVKSGGQVAGLLETLDQLINQAATAREAALSLNGRI